MAEDIANSSEAQFVLSLQTHYYADSVEWCPFQQFTDFMVSGTYQLDEQATSDETQTRQGDVVLYKFSSDTSKRIESCKLSVVDAVSTSGVLDIKWCPELVNNAVILGIACSDGKLLLLKMDGAEDHMRLTPFVSDNLGATDKKILLSLDWSCQNQGPTRLIASDSTGAVNFLQLEGDGLHLLDSWKAHQHESWIAAFDYSQPSVVYSGGDDCMLKGWDIRDLTKAIFVSKRHSMGVTAISKSKRSQYLLATGSYDENVFLWDTRSLKAPLSDIVLYGGIWRLKWNPHNADYLLSASMHSGFHVLSTQNDVLKLAVHYDKHESLAYGVDWHQGSVNQAEPGNDLPLNSVLKNLSLKNLIASCSFYDKLLHIWGINF